MEGVILLILSFNIFPGLFVADFHFFQGRSKERMKCLFDKKPIRDKMNDTTPFSRSNVCQFVSIAYVCMSLDILYIVLYYSDLFS